MNDTLRAAMTAIACAGCGIEFHVPKAWDQDRRRDHRTFYCPNGHSNYYPGRTREEELKAELERAERSARYNREELDRTRRSLAATKGVLTRTKNRIAEGKCPHCRAEFPDLAAHIQEKHAAADDE